MERRVTACLNVVILPREKEKLFQGSGFSKRKLVVFTDHQYAEKTWPLSTKTFVPYILDSAAFITVVPKLLVKELKETGSGVVGARLEKDVEMKTAVKDVVIIAK